jgi:drug/metabolite transporter (DMT)-like permease
VAVLLALATSVCYGVSNFLGPRLSRGAPTYVVLAAGQLVAFTVSGIALAATGGGIGARSAAAAVLAGAGNAAGLICFYRAATYGPLAIITPLGALGALVAVAAGLAAGEPLGAVKALGIALAIGGCALAARPASGDTRTGDRALAIRWALAASLAFGVFLAAIAPASEDGVLGAVFVSRAALLVLLVLVALRLGEPLRAPSAVLPKLAVPGILLFAGTLSYAAATREGDLSVVSVLGTLFPIVTVGLAFAIGRERVAPWQLAGVVAAIVGTVLLGSR